jgi:hypothetical protein
LILTVYSTLLEAPSYSPAVFDIFGPVTVTLALSLAVFVEPLLLVTVAEQLLVKLSSLPPTTDEISFVTLAA